MEFLRGGLYSSEIEVVRERKNDVRLYPSPALRFTSRSVGITAFRTRTPLLKAFMFAQKDPRLAKLRPNRQC